MTTAQHQKLDPNQAIERIFEIIRQEAMSNPTFTRRMLEAVGVSVMFTGNDSAVAVDPIIAAARYSYDDFREMFMTFTEQELKKLLKGFLLATDEQVKAVTSKPKKDGLIDLLWRGAKRRLSENGT